MPIYLEFNNLIVNKSALSEEQYEQLKSAYPPAMQWEDDFLFRVTGSMGEFYEEDMAPIQAVGLQAFELNSEGEQVCKDYCFVGSCGVGLYDPCEWIDTEYLQENEMSVKHVDDVSAVIKGRETPI